MGNELFSDGFFVVDRDANIASVPCGMALKVPSLLNEGS